MHAILRICCVFAAELGSRVLRACAVRASAFCACLLCAGARAAFAASCSSPLEGDAQRGARLAQPCMACHDGSYRTRERAAEPDYPAPRIRNQRAEYLLAALADYRRGERDSVVMHAEATVLSDRDAADLAAYFSRHADDESTAPAAQPVDAERRATQKRGATAQGTNSGGITNVPPRAPVRRTPLDSIPATQRAVCGACHGEAGLGILPESPILAGQDSRYLQHALDAYADGRRRSDVMAAYAKSLSAADIRALSNYFSRQGKRERLPGSPVALPPGVE